ncbi:MAG: hypothetical protein QOD99_3020 [Chthoniobacter sp.]|nr:hypothetical protein [Chthoniobacter sp.]
MITRLCSEIDTLLARLIESGVRSIGEIAIQERFFLTHHADVESAGLQLFNSPLDARELSRYDDGGNFRPLKSAPSLRRGWRLGLRTIHELREALDFFYPAMLGTLLAHERRLLAPVHLRETLHRQSGMYAVAKKITDAAANELIGDFCRSDGRCLKTILWKIEPDTPVTSLPAPKFDPAANQLRESVPAIPLLCAEGCNLLVAAARRKVRGEADEP